MYRAVPQMMGCVGRLGAVDTTQWYVGQGFWSDAVGQPPCPAGSVATDDGIACLYSGVLADKNPDGQQLKQWIADRCGEDKYVAIADDPNPETGNVPVFVGPAAPEKPLEFPLPPPNTPACPLPTSPEEQRAHWWYKNQFWVYSGVAVVGVVGASVLIYYLVKS